MSHSNLRVEVQGPCILVAMRGTCLKAKYRKQEAPWLAMDEYAEDSEAPMTFKEFPDSRLGSRQREGSRPWMGEKLR
jgi:hypothetical protein